MNFRSRTEFRPASAVQIVPSSRSNRTGNVDVPRFFSTQFVVTFIMKGKISSQRSFLFVGCKAFEIAFFQIIYFMFIHIICNLKTFNV